ncbi:MAG: type II secretion system F family protein [Candidatus Hydrothermarchaeales archaeon]
MAKLKFTIPERLVPEKILKKMDLKMVDANLPFSGIEWFTIWLILGFFLFLIPTLLGKFFIGLGGILLSLVLMVVIPTMQADKRRGAIEATFPDALHHMAVAVRTGLVLEGVIQEISEADYGPLSEEFGRVTVEIRRGRPLKDALTAFADRTDSKNVQRSMRMILEGVEAGGPIADVLDEVSDDLRAVRMIQRERKSSTSQQTSFLGMASLIAGPFVMGTVAALPAIMAKVAGPGYGGGEIEAVVGALSFYVVAQALSGGLMMGVVMYGSAKKGIKLSIPMGIAAYVVFMIVKFIMPSVTTMMG